MLHPELFSSLYLKSRPCSASYYFYASCIQCCIYARFGYDHIRYLLGYSKSNAYVALTQPFHACVTLQKPLYCLYRLYIVFNQCRAG